ncbi:YciI family protein [Zavarzinella formosa]|uniref:YciI family protein n=1 Tax=Zavarzinella formosa TaxID=360055 RepID=UPI0003007053|nr:YciI family protein [Zavarzinella formosa]
MKYMLLMYGGENCWTDEERKDCMIGCLKICEELAAQGKFIATSPLQPITTAATVRVRDGRTLITDGPFAETTEHLGGYFVLDLADIDEAIEIASRLPPINKGTAEIRPLLSIDGLPPARPFPVGSVDPNGTPYMLICYDDETKWREADSSVLREAMVEAALLARRLSDAGKYLNASPLQSASTAACVRVRDGKRQVTAGPFAETHEVLGGFYLILAESHEAALRVAAQHPGARLGSVEVRPLFDFSELQYSVSIS